MPKCLAKARYYTEKAVDQGSRVAQCILAKLIEDSDSSNCCEEEVFLLNILAAFQGHATRRCSWEGTMQGNIGL